MSKINFSTPLTEITFTVADTETTGMSPEWGDVLVEVGAVKITPPLTLELRNYYDSLINPGRPIAPAAIAIHGITDDLAAAAPAADIVITEFAEFIKGSVLVLHNAPFDIKFITDTLNKHRITSPISLVLDTLAISRKLNPHLGSHSLDRLIQYHDITPPRRSGNRHRALYDADITAVLFLKMIGDLQDMGLYCIGDIYEFLGNRIG